jgi:hypothetical protein
MWDTGNFISFGTQSNLPYGTLTSTIFISEPNVWPQVAIAYTTATSGTLEWGNGGYVGMNGSPFGSNLNFSGTYSTTNQGRNGTYWVNQNYGLANPTICYLWFTIQQPTVNTTITGTNDNREPYNPPIYLNSQSFSVTGSRIILGQMFLSVRTGAGFPNGFAIPKANIETFLSNYVQSADIRMF